MDEMDRSVVDRFPKPVSRGSAIRVQEIKPGQRDGSAAATQRPDRVIFAFLCVQELNACSRQADDFTNRGERLYVHSI
ncbi:hypothetical protein ACIRD3_15225 [Kitasatospora sp. NPDC093550]|uniref:hypothetical protein n=1 Tax=Kitasatospora sp. NPDC093550 TaxID=3364089 RepID=UPI00382B5F2E